jgi:ubiquinone biosynthesis protein COQ9
MTEELDFDQKVLAAAFEAIAARGWAGFEIAAAARTAGLPLPEVRRRFPRRMAVLVKLGRLADAHALGALDEARPEGEAVRDLLFEMLMRRIDVLQRYRAGVIAILRALPFDPPLAAFLTAAHLNSMSWLLAAAGVSTRGPLGRLRCKGLLAVWLWTLRTWARDESPDLSATMAALDDALRRAERAAGWLQGGWGRSRDSEEGKTAAPSVAEDASGGEAPGGEEGPLAAPLSPEANPPPPPPPEPPMSPPDPPPVV